MVTYFSDGNAISGQGTSYVLEEDEFRKLLLLLIVRSLQAGSSLDYMIACEIFVILFQERTILFYFY